MTETLEVVDLCLPGLNCPMPVLRAKKALAKMAGGTLLRVVSTDRHSLADLAEFCRQTGPRAREPEHGRGGGRIRHRHQAPRGLTSGRSEP